MIFNSVAFAIFLSIVFVLFWIVPNKFKWIVILISSCYYYMSWEPKYIIWILIAAVISYFSSILIEKNSNNIKKKKSILTASVVLVLGMLLYFKYFVFISESITTLLHKFAIPVESLTLKTIMPVGISFYTFQTIAYMVDVYRGKLSPELHFGKYFTFISFFPQVLSGPIPRADVLLPQINDPKPFSYDTVSYGARQMAWGYFKKLVVSALCATYVNSVYNNVTSYSGFVLVLATVLYAFQIYCDFSGYSDIAIGTAKLFGINLGPNFKTPYFSQTIKEFWSRWHISLSTWFRDYVYIPLGGNRVSISRYAFNIIITMLLSGIWHGASWTFILWGFIHGVIQVLENFIYKIKFIAPKQKDKKIFTPRGLITLLLTFAVVCFTWIFFRANTITEAFYVVINMFEGVASPISYIISGVSSLNISNEDYIRLVLSMIILILGDSFLLKTDVFEKLGEIKPVWRWIIYIVVLLAIVVFTPSDASTEFIYFNF